MSGGSYDYAYSKIDELRRWWGTLDAMAKDCRGWAADPDLKQIVDGTWAPAILVRGLLLERAAERLRAAIAEVQALVGHAHLRPFVINAVDRLTGKLPT